MQLKGEAVLLRVFTGEADHIGHMPVYECIVKAAREKNIAGATVLRGIMGFGASSIIHTARLIEISGDLPIVVEIVDTENKIQDLIPVIGQLFEQSKKGGLITMEKVNVLFYHPDK
jgi:PII-like signaling protein